MMTGGTYNEQAAAEPPALFVNVPPRPTIELVGRDDLLANLIDRLLSGKSPALSTADMPGVGKTALALELVYRPEVQAHFCDGILWGSLSREPDVAGIQAQWATALGRDISGILDPGQRSQAIGTAIGRRQMLAVLDDAWTLGPAQLLRPGGIVTCLLTTRDEEIAQHFAPTQHIHVPSLEEDPSLELLRKLAPKTCEADPQAAAELAKATGGVPLTLKVLGGYLAEPEHSQFPDLGQQAFKELADPRKRLALAEARLGGRLDQEQTLEAAISLSVEQLEQARPEAAAAFHALGAFAPKPATFDRAAAEAVTGTDGAVLALLIARNLLEAGADDTLTLHQSLADYAGTHTPDDARARHREHYLALVSEDRKDWQRIEKIYDRYLHAWRQLVSACTTGANVVDLVDAINTYQRLRGLRLDELRCLESALACAQKQEDTGETARLLNNIGGVYDALGDKRKAFDFYEQALPLRRQVGDRGGEATTLNNIGGVYDALGDKRRALDFYEQALPLRRQVGDRWGESITRYNMGMVYEGMGDLVRAEEELKVVVELDAAIEHPDLGSDRAALERIQAKRAGFKAAK
jgi:tetratricopeptide (TPR) repeat protein